MKKPKEQTHSKKLEWILRDFIDCVGESCYDNEISKGIIKSYFKLENGMYVKRVINIRKEDYVCSVIIGCCRINPSDNKEMTKCILKANLINLELEYGHFEVDVNAGEIVFKYCYEPDDVIYSEGMDKLLGYPIYVVERYGRNFID